MQFTPQRASGYQYRDSAFDESAVLDMGEGPDAVLFLHGLFGTPQHWHPVMSPLAARYRVVAPQLPVDRQPGRRRSGVRTIGELTNRIEQLVEDLKLQNFVICGNSLGGLVSIDYCLRNQGRVAGLVLAGSAGLYERGITNTIRPGSTRAFVRATALDILYDKSLVTDQLVDEWYTATKDRDYVRFLLRISRATRDCNIEKELGYLKLPTLIVWGRNDEITPPAVAETFRQRIESAELLYLDHCGHSPNLEKPEQFSEALQGFLPRCFTPEPCGAKKLAMISPEVDGFAMRPIA